MMMIVMMMVVVVVMMTMTMNDNDNDNDNDNGDDHTTKRYIFRTGLGEPSKECTEKDEGQGRGESE